MRTWLRTSVGNLAPTGISRALGCVRIVREDVREGSFGDRWEWSLLVVTANGHWLDECLDGARGGGCEPSQSVDTSVDTGRYGSPLRT